MRRTIPMPTLTHTRTPRRTCQLVTQHSKTFRCLPLTPSHTALWAASRRALAFPKDSGSLSQPPPFTNVTYDEDSAQARNQPCVWHFLVCSAIKVFNSLVENCRTGTLHHPHSRVYQRWYCFPHSVTPNDCRSGPVTTTQYVDTVHSLCPQSYAYSYDETAKDGALWSCRAGTRYPSLSLFPTVLPPPTLALLSQVRDDVYVSGGG